MKRGEINEIIIKTAYYNLRLYVVEVKLMCIFFYETLNLYVCLCMNTQELNMISEGANFSFNVMQSLNQ